MTAASLVSVIMPAYNAEMYVERAIESILNQMYRDFEFIIIDSSTDATSEIIAGYQQIDDRIRFRYQENLGLVDALNIGCRLSRGKYIARMDADDVSLPERLQKQIARAMERHPEVGIIGKWTEYILKFCGL